MAIEIRLDPGYLTYWREPGDGGLPPTLDTGGSQNVAAVAMDFPVPRVLDEGGATLYGYQGAVTFPLRVTPIDPAQPVTLAVDLDYAVCAAICLPGKAAMRLTLPDRSDPEVTKALADAQAAVPRPSTVGAAGSPAVLSVDAARGGEQPSLRIAARAASGAQLLVEAPEGWYLRAGPSIPAAEAGGRVFPVAIEQRPAEAVNGPLRLRLTLIDGSQAVDVPVSVDGAALKP